jgi:hypothetical protein
LKEGVYQQGTVTFSDGTTHTDPQMKEEVCALVADMVRDG